jgi:predicted metalloprotease
MRRLVGTPVVVTVMALVVAGCTNLLAGKPVSVFADPFRVAGMPATSGPSGLRPDAIGPTRNVENTNGGKDDELAAQAVSDVEQFWKNAYRKPLEGRFQPATGVYSWDAREYGGEFCGNNTYELVNAMYCWDDNNMGWDRGELFPQDFWRYVDSAGAGT